MTKNIKELEQEEEELSQAVRSSAQQIWQAGLGAFAKAQQEGGREFTRLVRDGSELQKRARQVEDATDTVARKAERSSRRASGTWGKLEQVFEERVARALATIGVPARSEMEALNHRIDELERMLAELAGEHRRQAAQKKPAAKAATKKPAAKRTAAKRGAAE
ncbi:phasin family protein [Massilia sp. Mn16-1_5]|uniref:phasin family protein n=1 Tax=Massilia sp. Mn16-1_5 TaxID=2079199 RepID=UPI00109E9FDE|nr:phasin family protein [Massilia sp. Mn16-1_5]THC40732.1 polygranule-associated protein [Massilia sp. Mn16-1_5]